MAHSKAKKAKKAKKKVSELLANLPEPEVVQNDLQNFSGFASMSFSYNGITVQLSADDTHLNDMIDLYEHLKDRLTGAHEELSQDAVYNDGGWQARDAW
jgi:hypothetical protein